MNKAALENIGKWNLLSCKFGESKWNPYWLIMLTSSSGTNHVIDEHEDIDQYDSYPIPSEVMMSLMLITEKDSNKAPTENNQRKPKFTVKI